jgi:hypothetical protein
VAYLRSASSLTTFVVIAVQQTGFGLRQSRMTSSLAIVFCFFQDIAVRTILILLSIWILINVLFVVIMTPPRKLRKSTPQDTGALAPVRIDQNGYPFEEQEDKLLLRHVIISIAMGTFFSLAPPLIEAIESIKRFFRSHRQ